MSNYTSSSIQQFGNALNNALVGMEQSKKNYDASIAEIEYNREKQKIDRDRRIMSLHFDTASKMLDTEMKSFFDDLIQNPDTSTYQTAWDNKYNELMNSDHLKNTSLNDEEAQRYIDERGEQFRQLGDFYVSYYSDVAKQNELDTNTAASFSIYAMDDKKSIEDSYNDYISHYNANGGVDSDLKGKNNPYNTEKRYSFASQRTDYSSKKLIEKSIKDPNYSFDDAMEDISKLYDENMDWVGATDKESAVKASIATGKEELLADMATYWTNQNKIEMNRSKSKAEPANAMFAEANVNGSFINEDKFKATLESKLDIEGNKNDRQVYLDSLLAMQTYNENLTKGVETDHDRLLKALNVKQANNENITDIDSFLKEYGFDKEKDAESYAKEYQYVVASESDLRKNETNRAVAVGNTEKDFIRYAIASGEYEGDAVAYGHEGLVDATDENASLSYSLDTALWALNTGNSEDIPAVPTRYSKIVDEIAEKHNITDPDQKRIIASMVNDEAISMNAVENVGAGTGSSSSGGWNSAEAYLYSCILDTGTYDSADIKKMHDELAIAGMLSQEFEDKYYTDYFGSDGSKRNTVWMKRAMESKSKLEEMLGIETSKETASRLMYMMDSNGEVLMQLERWERANPNATEADRNKFLNDIIIGVSSKAVAEDLQTIIDNGFRYASGRTDASAVDRIFTVESAYKTASGSLSYLVNTDAVAMAKKKLYSDSAKTYKKKDLINDIVSTVTDGRFKNLDELENSKDLSENEKKMYKNVALINASVAVSDVAMYKQAEQVAKSASSIFGVSDKTGRNLQEVHIQGKGNAVIDDQGFVYIAEGSDAVGIFYLDPNSDRFKQVKGSSSASVYPTELVAGGTYQLNRAIESNNIKVEFSQYYDMYRAEQIANFNTDPGDLESNTGLEGKTFKYVTKKKKDGAYMSRDPELYSILERLYQ